MVSPLYTDGRIFAGDSFHFRHVCPPSVGLRPFTGSGKGMVEMPEGGRTAVIDLTEADVIDNP